MKAKTKHRVYLSLGSNLEPVKYLNKALRALRRKFGKIIVSPAYQCKAVGFEGPDFINLAVGIDTEFSPTQLNDYLHKLETRCDRDRTQPRWSSRTLDIDIVLFDDLIIEGENNLQIPRDELKHAFVLKPLADIASAVLHPTLNKTIGALWNLFPNDKNNLREIELRSNSIKSEI